MEVLLRAQEQGFILMILCCPGATDLAFTVLPRTVTSHLSMWLFKEGLSALINRKLLEGRDGFSSLCSPQQPAQGLVNSRHSINVYRISEWMSKSMVCDSVNAIRKHLWTERGMWIIFFLIMWYTSHSVLSMCALRKNLSGCTFEFLVGLTPRTRNFAPNLAFLVSCY